MIRSAYDKFPHAFRLDELFLFCEFPVPPTELLMMSGGDPNKFVTPIIPPQLDPPPGDDALGEFDSPAAEVADNSSCCNLDRTP